MEYDNTNTITIFKNNKKSSEKSPDYTGRVNVNGDEKEVSLWIRESKSGNKFLSGTVREPFNGGNKQTQKPQLSRQAAPPVNDDVPFAKRKDY